MKRSYLFATMIVLMASLFSACHIEVIRGDKNIKETEFPIGAYDKLHIEGGNIELTYQQSGEAPFLKIETDQNILDNLQVKIVDDELIIRPKNKQLSLSPTQFVITTNSSALEGIRIAGSGNANLGSGLKGDELSIDMAGESCVTADSITFNELNCKMAGDGTLALSGKTDKMYIKGAGNCQVKSFDLETNLLDCKSAGNCEVEITVKEEIKSYMAGNGEIKYKGNPQQITRKNIGSSSLIQVTD